MEKNINDIAINLSKTTVEDLMKYLSKLDPKGLIYVNGACGTVELQGIERKELFGETKGYKLY